ncbi:MAG TPA: multicopper oxidase family protein [Myxococcales bacterium]|nr:multicopper oxidase family protein [Myxococcales bacterium]
MKYVVSLIVSLGLVSACASSSDSPVDEFASVDGVEPVDEPAPERTPDPNEQKTEPEPVAEPELELAPLPELLGVPLAEDLNDDPKIIEINLTAQTSEHVFIEDTVTPMWTYNGQFPGPAIQARVGDRLIVHFTNNLPDSTTVHWHGLRVPNEMDGAPLVQQPVQPGETFTYDFKLKDAGSYWYHPHVQTHIQVERGLYGPIVVHEAEPPAYDVERIVFLDDIRLEMDGNRSPFNLTHPERMHGRYGNVLLLNGKAVDEGDSLALRHGVVERWRVMNSANARTAQLDLMAAEWRVIASDGGLVPEPFTTELLQIAPGERYDLEMRWNPESAEDSGELRYWVPVVENEQVKLAPIVLQTLFSNDEEALAAHDVELPEVTLPEWPVEDMPTITIELDGKPGFNGQIQWMLNGKVYGQHIPIKVDLGSYHTIDIVNKQAQVHPMHIHGHFFQVISRNGKPVVNEAGFKDTVMVGAKETVRLSILFDNPGQWMYHCHILEHAKMGMMGVIEVY